MKVIFLDIDGVLNSTRWIRSLGPDNWPSEHIDPAAVAVLNEIVAQSPAKIAIVISSTWRKQFTLDFIVESLRKNGLSDSTQIIGQTPDFFALRHERDGKPYVRGDEIIDWLRVNSLAERAEDRAEGFVILDDGDDMGILTSSLLQTTGDDGLLWAHIEPALAMLGGATAGQCRKCGFIP